MAYHHHAYHLIVSKEELAIQLWTQEHHENLIYCLALGRAGPEYEQRLLMACMKLQFIGSLFYPKDTDGTAKLRHKAYERFFDACLKSIEEAQEWLQRLETDACSPQILLEKYTAVKEYCLPMLTSGREVWRAGEYRQIIEYIIDSGSVPKAMPRPGNDIPELPFPLAADIEYGNYQN